MIRRALVCLGVAAVVGLPVVQAAPALRKQVDQRGDFVVIGNTLGWDCSPGVPAPVVGNVSNMCGINTADTAADLFWRADQPPGGATADLTITSDQARSTAVLNLPAGATVTYARLYWAALKSGPTADQSVTVDREGLFSTAVNADQSFTVQQMGTNYFYQSTADVTDLIATRGPGAFRISGVESLPVANLNHFNMFANWALVVFYQRDTDPPRNLALFDGLDRVQQNNNNIAQATLTGFLVPASGFDAKLGVITYEGDEQAPGDLLAFNSTLLSDAMNPQTNFFNGTRSYLGTAVSVAGDLPQTTGAARSLSGMDLDVVDVTRLVKSGDTSATILATSSGDTYLLGAFITSISTFKPDFANTAKTVRDVTSPNGPVRPGDILEYTVAVRNTGNDTAVDTVLTDTLPLGVTYVPGSLQVTTGANAGAKTDLPLDDQGEYLAPSRTIKVRLGTGANGLVGGTMAPEATTTVVFRVTIDMTATGTISNQAVITAKGQNGNPLTDYASDGNGVGAGNPPTVIAIDECGTNTDCPMAKPFCMTARDPNVCVECLTNTNCPMAKPFCNQQTNVCGTGCATDMDCGGATPACLPGGTCGQCSATNTTACSGTAKACDVAAGLCVECTDNASCPAARPICNTTSKSCVGCITNAHCGGTTPYCSPTSSTCVGCMNDTQCFGNTPACQPNGSCAECSATNLMRCTGTVPVCNTDSGKCVTCKTNTQCAGVTPVCETGICRSCRGDTECSGATPACLPTGACGQCSATNNTQCTGATPVCDAASGRCVGCVTGLTCPTAAPVCDPTTRACRTCAGNAECPMNAPVCLPNGSCGQCSAGNTAACTGATPLCDTAAGRCVACLTNAECSGNTPFCSPTTRTCVPCTADGAPSCTDPARPACQTTGPLAGACTECSATNAGRCVGAKPICVTGFGLCGCTNADGDAECGGAMSGLICSGVLGVCVPGCSTAAGRNGCPSGQMCNNGACVAAAACNTNMDCAAPRPVCDLTAPRACVQCVDDAQCASPLVCDATGTKTCVECTATKAGACSATLAGSRCLPGNTCGCTADTDCGAAGSGRVCDTTAGKCTFGCRAGGNNCPPGRSCSATGMALGQCMLPPPPDGGADAGSSTTDGGGADAPRADGGADGPRADAQADAPADARLDGPADGRISDAPADARLDGALADVGGAGSDAAGDAPRDVRVDTAGSASGRLGGGGCACSVPGTKREGSGLVLVLPLAIVGLTLARRRRR